MPIDPRGLQPGPAGEAVLAGPAFGPVRPPERVLAIDVLRGFALLGILVMNVYAFGLVFPAYQNPFVMGGTDPIDVGTWWVTYLVFDMKFMTQFTVLFGAGLALMADRAAARGAEFARYYYRRLVWLAIIGFLHAYLIWYGDILFTYAIFGTILYPMRRVRPAALLAIGVLMLSLYGMLAVILGNTVLPTMETDAAAAIAARDAGEELTEEQEAAIRDWDVFFPADDALAEERRVYAEGTWLDQVRQRAPLVAAIHTGGLLLGIWRTPPLMLIGMALLELGVLSARRSMRFYAGMCLVGYPVGLALSGLGATLLFARDFDPVYAMGVGSIPNWFGSLGVAAGHVGLVMLVVKSGALRWLTSRLAAVGRMALSNYLAHSIICTTIFYSWGLGLFGSLSRFQLMGVVLAVWIVQLTLSPIWLRHFRYGPAEWLWRTLTYGERQPMRSASGEPAGTTPAR